MKAFTVYLRILVVLLVVGAIGLILFKNRSYSVQVWLFGLTDSSRPVNVVWVMLATGVCTLTAWWIISLCRGLIRDLREVRRAKEAAIAKKMTDLKVAEIDTRQRKIEEQFKHTVGDAPGDATDVGY